MYLLTEDDNILATESGNQIVADSYETCSWPTLEEVKLELGVTGTDDDIFLQRQINATISSMESYCGRKLNLQVDTETFHITECDRSIGYQTQLQLHRWPVYKIIEIDGMDTEVKIDEGGLLCGNFYLNATLQVTYHGGIGCPLPDDLLDVFYQIINVRYAAKGSTGTSGELKSESIPGVIKLDYFQNADNAGGGSSGSDPSSYSDALRAYKAYYV